MKPTIANSAGAVGSSRNTKRNLPGSIKAFLIVGHSLVNQSEQCGHVTEAQTIIVIGAFVRSYNMIIRRFCQRIGNIFCRKPLIAGCGHVRHAGHVRHFLGIGVVCAKADPANRAIKSSAEVNLIISQGLLVRVFSRAFF